MSLNRDTSAGGRTYYPGPGIVVTSAYIENGENRYPVRELTVENVHYFYAYPARMVALYCAAVEVLLAAVVAALYGSAEMLLCAAGVVAAAGLGGAIWADDQHNPRRLMLIAWHGKRRVVLFESTDQRIFEQVRRAVVRALEANRLPSHRLDGRSPGREPHRL